MKVIFTILLLIPLLASYYLINKENFLFQQQADAFIIEHPEKLPRAEYAALMFPGFSNVIADLYWLQAIQYVGRNAVSSEYKKYFYEMMHLISELNPYFESPYILGQLLLPSWNNPNEDFTPEQMEEHTKRWEELWLKWIENFCDTDKIELIDMQDNLGMIIQDQKYKNPCRSFMIPYYLAYIYFYYMHDHSEAAKYYKVVSAQDDAPRWARILAGIMQGRAWEREKSLFMFLSLAQTVQQRDEACMILSSEIERIYNLYVSQNMPLTGEFLRETEILRDQVLPRLSDENEDVILSDTECSNFLTKAIRELSLLYLEQADAQYITDFPDEISAMTPERLFELWYINFIPTDYQQHWDYGIIYRYSEDSGRFDYQMGY